MCLFIRLQFYSLDKADTPLKHFLFPNSWWQTCFACFKLYIVYIIYIYCLYFLCIKIPCFHCFFLLQPFQFGITRTQRESADIPSWVSLQWLKDSSCFHRGYEAVIVTVSKGVNSTPSLVYRSLSMLHKLEELDLGNNELYSLVSCFCLWILWSLFTQKISWKKHPVSLFSCCPE